MENKICNCWQCEGKGEIEIEVDCDCEGCFEGYHAYDFDCGQTCEDVPCEKCDATGQIKKMVTCEQCNGTGLDHTFFNSDWQQDLSGRLLRVRKCMNCGFTEFKTKEVELIKSSEVFKEDK